MTMEPTTRFRLGAPMLAMLGMVIFVGLGEKMAERFLPLYLLALGGGTIAIGGLNALVNLLGALYSFPGGWLSDRIGYKRSLMVFTAAAMAGYLFVLLVPHWWAVLVGALLFIAWTAISLPAVMSLVADVVPKERRTLGVTLHSLVRRIPMALGPLLGGWLVLRWGAVDGVRAGFAAAFLLAGVALAVMWKLAPSVTRPVAPASRGLWLRFTPALRNLLAADILIRFAEQIPYAFVVLWVVDICRQSSVEFGVLTAIEMVTAMLVYLPIALLADRTRKRPFVLITFGFFTLFPLILIYSRTLPMLCLAFVIRGLKEFGEPARKALILDLAPPDSRAGAFGLYYLIRDVIVAVAAFGGAFLWRSSPQLNLWIAFACGVAGTLCFAWGGRRTGPCAGMTGGVGPPERHLSCHSSVGVAGSAAGPGDAVV